MSPGSAEPKTAANLVINNGFGLNARMGSHQYEPRNSAGEHAIFGRPRAHTPASIAYVLEIMYPGERATRCMVESAASPGDRRRPIEAQWRRARRQSREVEEVKGKPKCGAWFVVR
jgi:hypothetical protein